LGEECWNYLIWGTISGNLTAVENDDPVSAAHVAGAVRDKQHGGTA